MCNRSFSTLLILSILLMVLLSGCNLALTIYDDYASKNNSGTATSPEGSEGGSLPQSPETQSQSEESPSPSSNTTALPTATPDSTSSPAQTPTPASTPIPSPSPGQTPRVIKKEFHFDTTSTGANVNADIVNFPLLLRIKDTEILSCFASGKPDLYFVDKENGSTLKYEIEYYNLTENLAVIWVLVPLIEGNSNSGFITMYIDNTNNGEINGNTDTEESPVFKGTDGFVSVWHMSDEDNTPVITDATDNHHGTLNVNTNLISASGIIGNGMDMSTHLINCGKGDDLDNMTNMTWSAWIRPDVASEASLFFKSNSLSPMLGVGIGINALYFSAGFDISNMRRASQGNAIVPNRWNHIAAVWNGDPASTSVHLYINGKEVSYGPPVEGAGNYVDNSAEDFIIGNNSAQNAPFRGMIDEVIVTKSQWTPDRIKLTYENQKEGQTFISDPVDP